jgi:hypothetical protein
MEILIINEYFSYQEDFNPKLSKRYSSCFMFRIFHIFEDITFFYNNKYIGTYKTFKYYDIKNL